MAAKPAAPGGTKRSHGRPWAPALLAALAVIGFAAAAIALHSVTRNRIELHDGTVWVTALERGKAARFNVRNREADAAIASSSTRFDVLQHQRRTILTEASRMMSIDAATLGVDDDASAQDDLAYAIGGDNVAAIDQGSGQAWVAASDDLAALATGGAHMDLGAGGKIVVDHQGVLYGYRPQDGMVLTIASPSTRGPTELESLSNGAWQPADSFSVIDGVPLISTGNIIRTAQGAIVADEASALILQSPPTDDMQSGWAVAADRRGLAIFKVSGSSDLVWIDSGGSGEVAQPASARGCVHAAFAQQRRNYIRVCSPTPHNARLRTLESITPTSDLVFRVNHGLVVLNDVARGSVWNPRDSTKAVTLQWDDMPTQQVDGQQAGSDSARNAQAFSDECSTQQSPIQAKDDSFAVRAGSSRILDVLRNDEQTECAVLAIDSFEIADDANATINPIYDGRYLQFDATAASAGSVTFRYAIGDGRSQRSSATVSITILGNDRNQPPAQLDAPQQIDIEQGASISVNALGGFADPDGDPIALAHAEARNAGQVRASVRPDGQLIFHTGSLGSGRVSVELVVSDGKSTATGLIFFSIRPAGTLPAIIEPVIARGAPAQPVTVALSPHVHGTSAQPVRLSGVDTPDGISIGTDTDDLTFTITAANPGTYYISYVIGQGDVSATGLVRFEASPGTDDTAKPVIANDVALLGIDGTAIVEPLRNDVDPAGGVLAVTETSTPSEYGISVGIADHHRLYLTARQMPSEPVSIRYQATSSTGTGNGTIVLYPPALTATDSVIKAGDINAQVRTGGIVTINVLDHVDCAHASNVKLDHALRLHDDFRGLAFATEDAVRYQASDRPGNDIITYTVTDEMGNVASGTITITVHAADMEHKAAPIPLTVESQVAAGRTVRIPITLTGIDTDGDDIQLLGLGNQAPSLGRVNEVGADYLVYEAYADSHGTDEFTYALEDWTGQRAQGRIRVGIVRNAPHMGVIARDDAITLRPGTTATVQVTDNDLAGGDGVLTLSEHLESQHVDNARVEDNAITFTTTRSGTAYIVYTVSDESGIADSATLTVRVDPQAPIQPPIAYDYRVMPADTIDKRSIDVDISSHIANPSGAFEEMSVSVPADSHASVSQSDPTIISVQLTDRARAIPYTVTNTVYGIESMAFIQVPAYGVFPPVLRHKAPVLTVSARSTITIDIRDHVRVGAGKEPVIASAESISATKAANTNWFVNEQTLQFTAPRHYSGPASITFTAADARQDEHRARIRNIAVITLRITVIGRDTPPPTFPAVTLEIEAGGDPTRLELDALTQVPHGLYDDEREYSYECDSPSSAHITAQCSTAGALAIAASSDAIIGAMATIPISIHHSQGVVRAGIVTRIVASTRPPARIPSSAIRLQAGETTTLKPLEHAYNPFPDTPLRLTDCTTDAIAALTVDCSVNGTLTVSAADNAGALNSTVLITVRDATDNPDRQTTGRILISVIDRPSAPLLSPVSGKAQDGAVTLTWSPGNANGSPVIEYRVQWSGHADGAQSCGKATSCRITGLRNGRVYAFSVTARNEVGWSEASSTVTATPDALPGEPRNVRIEGGHSHAVVTWDPPDNDASPTDNYSVTLEGAGGTASMQTGRTSARFTLDPDAITDGSYVTAQVKAHNAIGWGDASPPSDPAQVWADPDPPVLSMSNDDTAVTITVATGNMRNAGCERITVTGPHISATVECSSRSSTVSIDESLLNTTALTATATLHTRRATAAVSGAAFSFMPRYALQTPSEVFTTGANGMCTVHWKQRGRAQRFVVDATGITGPVTVTGSSHSFPMEPWSTCSNASVRQVFNGSESPAVSGGPAQSPAYTYKVKATITMPPMLVWHANDPDVITVAGGTVQTYGQPASVTIVVNGIAFAWQGGTLHVPALPRPEDGIYTWFVQVTGNDPALSSRSASATVHGARFMPEPEPEPEPEPQTETTTTPGSKPNQPAKSPRKEAHHA